MVISGELSFSIAYSTDHYTQDSIERFKSLFESNLKALIEHCVEQETVCYTPSDFPTTQLSQEQLDRLLAIDAPEKIYALAPLQEGLLFHALHDTGSDQYCVQMEWLYEGNLDVAALKAAWSDLINQHDILRTRFEWNSLECPIQMVQNTVALPWFDSDLSDMSESDQAQSIASYLEKDRFTGFDLTKPCAMRLHLLKLSVNRHQFIWTNHHILLDGWCLPILMGQLEHFYQGHVSGSSAAVQQGIPYERYINWIESKNKREAEDFWRSQLSPIESATNPGIQKAGVQLDPHKAITSLGKSSRVMSVARTEKIERLARESGSTVNSYLSEPHSSHDLISPRM
jgi:hypothetical protein